MKRKDIATRTARAAGRRTRGAALAEHGILVGLVALVSIGSGSSLGEKVSNTFSMTSTDVGAALEASESSAETGGAAGGGAGEEGAGTGDPASGGDTGGTDGTAPEPEPEPEPVVVRQDSFDEGTPLQVTPGRRLVFIDTANYGYTSSNDSAHHANSASQDTSGLAYLELDEQTIQSPGPYLVEILVGNFNNKPFVTDVEVGLRSNDAFLPALTSSTPEPALGDTETWSMTYDVTQEQIDAGITFGINVIYNGANRNASFDDLVITYNP